MLDEGLDYQSSVTPVISQDVAPAPQEQVPAPPPVAPVVEPAISEVPPTPPMAPAPPLEPHPLEPGGSRFRQVYARAKTAEERVAELDAAITEVRDQNIRLETELKLRRDGQQAPPQPTWIAYETAIAEGKITRAQAMDQWNAQVLDQAEARVQRQIEATQRRQAVNYDLTRYITAAPELNQRGSELRRRVDQEFDYLISVQGRDVPSLKPDERRVLELQAVRQILGPIEGLQRQPRPSPEAHVELSGQGTKPQPQVNPDQVVLNALKPEQVAYYRTAITNGMYKDWAEVVAELKWKPPTGSPFKSRVR